MKQKSPGEPRGAQGSGLHTDRPRARSLVPLTQRLLYSILPLTGELPLEAHPLSVFRALGENLFFALKVSRGRSVVFLDLWLPPSSLCLHGHVAFPSLPWPLFCCHIACVCHCIRVHVGDSQ